MKKIPLFLAVALMLCSNSFAEKRKKSFKEMKESSKDCRLVCENSKYVLYKGKKKIDIKKATDFGCYLIPVGDEGKPSKKPEPDFLEGKCD